jgi:hypothetical protein
VVYATGSEERELNRQELQLLKRQECFIGAGGPSAVKVMAVFMPGSVELCPSTSLDQVELLMEDQRQRVGLHLPGLPVTEHEEAKKGTGTAPTQLGLPLGDDEADSGGHGDGGFGR